MLKRLVLVTTAAVAVVLGSTILASAQAKDVNKVTLLLRSGERITGDLASFDQTTVDIRDNSGRRSVPFGDVVLMDFSGDARNLPTNEVNAVQQPEQTLVLRGGRNVRGRIVDFTQEGGEGAMLVFETSERGRESIPLGRVVRLYVSPMTTQALATATGGQATEQPIVSPSGGRTVTVMANTAWVDTGVAVRRGDRITLDTRGTIYLRANGQTEANPAGATDGSLASAPLPGLPAGALIGRIGNGRPFGVGNQTTIVAPESGELFLGINDDQLGDNSGQFTVTLSGAPVSNPYARPRQ